MEESGPANKLKRIAHNGNIFHIVGDYVRRCPICQKTRLDQGEVNVAVAVTNTLEPFECIAMDTIGALPSDDDGSCYIIALIDL